jgi:hypothetical protein
LYGFRTNTTFETIYYEGNNSEKIMDDKFGPWMVELETSPLLARYNNINRNILRTPNYQEEAQLSYTTESVVIGQFLSTDPGFKNSTNIDTAYYASLLYQISSYYDGSPLSNIFIPVYNFMSNTYQNNHRQIVGQLRFTIQWSQILSSHIPRDSPDLYVILSNACDDSYSYLIQNGSIQYLGHGIKQHDANCESFVRRASYESMHDTLTDGSPNGLNISNVYCPISIQIYPSKGYYEQHHTNKPIAATIAVAVSFVFTVLIFLCYDRKVEERRKILHQKAVQSTMVVDSLFPKNVREKLLLQQQNAGCMPLDSHGSMRGFLEEQELDKNIDPIAELFPNTTVMMSTFQRNAKNVSFL